VLGAIGYVMTKNWLGVPAAAASGFVLGAAWCEFSAPNDVAIGPIDSLITAVLYYGTRFIGPATLATGAGALVTGVGAAAATRRAAS
jgi:hypothetical protein